MAALACGFLNDDGTVCLQPATQSVAATYAPGMLVMVPACDGHAVVPPVVS